MYLLCCCSPDSKSENFTSGKQVSPLTPSLPRAPVPVLPAKAQHSKDRPPDLDIVPWEKQRHSRNNVFTVFLNKITKRLSGGVNFNGSESPCSKMMSEAELARRVELKRIRTRRIQEELKANNASPKQHKGEVSAPSLQNASRSLGPRDAIEFTINSDSLEPIVDDSQSFASSAQIEKRRNSFPAVGRSLLELRLPRKTISLNFASTYSNELPVSPETAHLPPPIQIKGCLEPSPTFDTVVGPGNCFSATFDDASWDRQSGLSLWLLSQSMPSGDTRSPSPVETRHDDAAIYAMNRSLSLAALNTIDSIVEMPLPVWDGLVHSSMGRHSQQAASVLAREPVPSNLSLQISVGKDHGFNADNCDQQKDRTEAITYHSSVNSSGDSGTTTPPAEHILSPEDLRTLELSPFHWHDTASVFRVSEKSGSQSSYATAAEILVAPRLRDEIGLITDGSRMNILFQSHRASLEHREFELQSVAKRFSEKAAHPKTWHSRTSRFLEDFSGIGPTTNTKRRLSSLFRLNPSSEASYAEATKDGMSEQELPPLRRTYHHVDKHTRDVQLPLSERIKGFSSISMPASFSAAVMTSLGATTPREKGNESVIGEDAQQVS